jgi:hypothetical protein
MTVQRLLKELPASGFGPWRVKPCTLTPSTN